MPSMPPSTRSSPLDTAKRSSGFSLVELVLVVTIIGTLAAIAAPRYTNALFRYRATAAAQRVVADLAFAQALARATSSTQTITFNVAASSYQLPSGVNAARLQPLSEVYLAADPYCATLVRANIGGIEQVSFNGYGIPNGGGSIAVRAGNTTRIVVLSAHTGTATIQ